MSLPELVEPDDQIDHRFDDVASPSTGTSVRGTCTVKKRLAIFPFPAGMSLTKLSLAGNNLIFLGQGESDR
jgi:hypothetical protein